MKRLHWRSLFWIYVVSVLAIEGFVFQESIRLIREGFPDFAIYYSAGWVARHGLTRQFYDNETHFAVQQQFAGKVKQFRDPLPFTHPPFEAWYFAPFSFAPFTTAFFLWDLFNLVLVASVVWMLRPYLRSLGRFSILQGVLVAMAFFPVFFCLLQGQDAILILFLYALVYVLLQRKEYVAGGAVLAFGLYKFHLVAPFALLALCWRERKLWYGFVPVSVTLGALSFLMVGSQGVRNYPGFVLLLENAMSGSEKIPAGMPSIRGLLYLLFPAEWNTSLLLTASCIALLAYTFWRSGKEQVDFNLKFSLALIATALVGYHVVSYDLSMLLIPMALLTNDLLGKTHSSSINRSILIFAMAVLFFSPLQLILSVKYKDFALMAIVLLLWYYGIDREIGSAKATGQPA